MNGVALPSPSPFRAVSLVARGVLLETLRRKEIYVLLILTLFFACGVGVALLVGIENPETATFLLNLGMTFAAASAHILTLLTAFRQIPDEIETRQIYPMLAKPLERRQYFLGKWVACWAAGLVALLALMTLAWGVVPKRETFDPLLLAQTALLLAASLSTLAAMTLCFSVLMPKGINLVLSALIVALGDKLVNLIAAKASGGPLAGPVRWIGSYVPDFGKFNLIDRYTRGAPPLSVGELAGLLLAGAIFTAFFVVAGSRTLERRPL